MLKETRGSATANRTTITKLSHNPAECQKSLFCVSCPDFERCGGISSNAGGHCYMHCCGGDKSCQMVCRNNPSFSAQVREIGGFDLENTPRVRPVGRPKLHGTAPMILHGNMRQKPLLSSMVTLKLRHIVDMETGLLRHKDRTNLANAFKFDPSAHIIITGIEQDKWVEPWWSLGRPRRSETLAQLSDFGIAAVTPPNFSLFCDVPRPNDFSAYKRIALIQAEFISAGIPCALHPHIITNTDSLKWIEYVKRRPEIDLISYEFTTGAGRTRVRDHHISHLINLAHQADRPLDLIVRGDQRVIHELAPYFRHIVYIDTSAFMKAIHRRVATRSGNRSLKWEKVNTPAGAPIDHIMQTNFDEVALFAQQLLSKAA